MPTHRDIAEAFSSHRFHDAYDHLAADVRWNLVGVDVIHGRDNVIATCEATLRELHTTRACPATGVRRDRGARS